MMRPAFPSRRLGTLLALLALAGAPAAARAGWLTYTSTQGLTSNNLTAVLGDRSGSMWFGTSGGGVSRYDGASWTTYRVADGLLSDRVSSIAQDSSGVMWFGTDLGASRFDGRNWESFSSVGGLQANPVNAICVDHANRVWFGTTLAGAVRYDGTTWRNFTTLDGLVANNVIAVAEDHTGEIWLGFHGAGISHYNGTNWTTIYAGSLPGNLVGTSIAEDRRGTLWISGESTLFAVTGNVWRLVTPLERGAPTTPLAYTTQAFVDRDDAVWVIEQDRGVSRYDGRAWQYFSRLSPSTRDPLPSDDVRAIGQGADGNMWFGTGMDGVARFDGSTWKTIEFNGPFNADPCTDCGLRDKRGFVYFAAADTLRIFDGSQWTYFARSQGFGLLASTLEARDGRLWFGSSMFDPATNFWAFVPAPLTGTSLMQDHLGQVWAGDPIYSATRWNGSGIDVYNASNTDGALPVGLVTSIVEDTAGLLWFAAGGGLATFDGSEWRNVRPALTDPSRVDRLLRDRRGRLWIASPAGLERNDGGTWTAFPRDGATTPSRITSLIEDRDGNLWMGTPDQGVFRFNGDQWGQYTTLDGLAESDVSGIVQDTSGTIWFEHPARLSRLFPDSRPPRTLLTLRPPAVSPSRSQIVEFTGAWAEAVGILYSTSLDGGPWSPWSSTTSWSATNLADGSHLLRVRSRDRIGNVEPTPAEAAFDIEATPPSVRLEAPASRAVVRDSITVEGSAADPRIREYRVEVRASGVSDWDPARVTLLARGTVSAPGPTLAGWNTRNFPDGAYDLRLWIADTLGLSSSVTVTVTVDNQFPRNDRTAPAVIGSLTGGDVYTTHGESHLYFAPHSFDQDAVVSVQPVPPDSVPPSLPVGAIKVLDGFDLSWASALRKPARLEISTAGVSASGGTLAIYHSTPGSAWTRAGGTFEAGAQRMSLEVQSPGRYAMFTDLGPTSGAGRLGPITFTPRVFSPSGSFSDRQVAIAFTLGRPAAVTVRVYSLSGRLIRSIEEGRAMNAGENLVRWDGRDREGADAIDGMYVVAVEALGETEKKTLAVVR